MMMVHLKNFGKIHKL